MIGEFKIDICDFMANVEPSVEEVLRVASVPARLESDIRSCDIGIDAVLKTVSGASVLITWASRWDVIEAMGAPFGMLLSNSVLPGTESGDHRIRLVFRLEHDGGAGTAWVKDIGASIIKDFNDDISARMLGVSATWRTLQSLRLAAFRSTRNGYDVRDWIARRNLWRSFCSSRAR
jgi:hypothetical protein